METTTEKIAPAKEQCKKDSCEHKCEDDGGVVRCSCKEGYRLQADKKSCKGRVWRILDSTVFEI